MAGSPIKLMKNFAAGKIQAEQLPKELKGLTNSRSLLLCRILNAADLATSAGLSKERTIAESVLLASETGLPIIAEPKSSAEFIENANLTDFPAARATYWENPLRIMTQLTGTIPLSSRPISIKPDS